MEKEEAKGILVGIMVDLVFAESDIDMTEVGPILQKHLGITDEDMKEVMNRFDGEMRDMFANHPAYPGSNLAKTLDRNFKRNLRQYRKR